VARDDSPTPEEGAETPARRRAAGTSLFGDPVDPADAAASAVDASESSPGDIATQPGVALMLPVTAPTGADAAVGTAPVVADDAAEGGRSIFDPAPAGSASPAAAPLPAAVAAEGADAEPEPAPDALSWVDPTTVALPIVAGAMPASPLVPAGGVDLLPAPPQRRGWIWPVAALGVLAVGYVAGCALWPLSNVEPRVSALAVETPAAAQFPLEWPADGGAAIGAADGPGILASNEEVIPMASITKTVTSLMIIERTGLEPGDDGPSYGFTAADSELYWYYLSVLDESSLDVPVGGSLTLHQMLQGIMLGSANNYVDRLVTELWESREAFVADAAAWLEENGLSGITIVDPSGIGPGNTATARSLIALAQRAGDDPVLAGIMAERSVDLPGAGEVENSNPLIGDEGVVGVKTGALWSTGVPYWNLLTAKNVQVGGTTVQLYAAVLGQPDDVGREEVSRRLLEGAEEGLQPVPAVAAETPVAHIATEWGASSEVVVAQDALIIPWEGAAAEAEPSYELEVGTLAGEEVGSLVVTGAFDETTVPLTLTEDVAAPSFWWRLTHPLALLGLE
jgi:D-alanyl-D-alanine carboxypeptidase (penicillin-binding protein 5/6)